MCNDCEIYKRGEIKEREEGKEGDIGGRRERRTKGNRKRWREVERDRDRGRKGSREREGMWKGRKEGGIEGKERVG